MARCYLIWGKNSSSATLFQNRALPAPVDVRAARPRNRLFAAFVYAQRAVRPIQPTESDTHGLSRPALLALWIASLALLLCGLGSAPVRRTQEARVLETAREMVGEDFRRWLIPHLNGRVRLEKPPLAYWLVA